MGGGDQDVGPDLSNGIPLTDLVAGKPYAGNIAGEPLLVVKVDDEVLAVGAFCTHYGGPLAEGLVVGDTIRCPWHQACFSLRTGEATCAPALNPVARWSTSVREGRVYLDQKQESSALDSHGRKAEGPTSITIIGAGAAGSAAAEKLRGEGYDGPIVMVDPDESAPYDRPNLSKDYLAGNAPEEWIPLRPEGFYAQHGIERVSLEVLSIDVQSRALSLSDGSRRPFDTLLLATGASPIRLDIPGADLPHVLTLRSLADARRIIEQVGPGTRAVVLGASFIGMEVAASLRQREAEVTVVAPESVPFEKTLGVELGKLIRSIHEQNGTQFRLGRTAREIRTREVVLDDGSSIGADVVIMGVGVRPATRLAEEAGLRVENGVVVDENFRTSAPGVYAVGDIARFPWAVTGESIRVEHWVVAQRQGQAAARSMLGRGAPFLYAPFFWSAHWDLSVRYVGHASGADEAKVEGDLHGRDGAVRFSRGGRVMAVATVGRDGEALRTATELERVARGRTASEVGPGTG